MNMPRLFPSIVLVSWLSASLLGAQIPSVLISEFMASNDRTLLDQDREDSDWIEIHNAGSKGVDLGGWYLTDDGRSLRKWGFPSPTLIAPGGFLVVFASAKNRAVSGKQLHTNFELRASGEFLALVAPGGQQIASAFSPYPSQMTEVSYGVAFRPGPTKDRVYFTKATPGQSNGLGDPVFTGVTHRPAQPTVTDDLVIEASALTPPGARAAGAELRYRIDYGAESLSKMSDDGRAPDRLGGDGIWTGVIPRGTAPAGRMLRWRVTAKTGGNAAFRAPLFHNPTNSPEYCGTVIADPKVTSKLTTIHWFVQDPSKAMGTSGTRCSLWLAGKFYDNVFVRRRGGSTGRYTKRNFKFDFNKGDHFLFDPSHPPVEEINLNATWSDKSFVRQVLSWETYGQAGVASGLSFPVRLQQNGSFHSVAAFVEQPDEDLLARNGLDPHGTLYKMYNTFTSSTRVEKKTRRWESNTDLAKFIAGVSGSSGTQRERFLFDHVDLPATLNYLAATVIIEDTDHPHKNHYLYRDTMGDGEWRFLPWDKDLTFGRNYLRGYGVLNDLLWANQDPVCHPLLGDAAHPNHDRHWNRLIEACHSTPRIRSMFLRRLRTLMDRLLQSPGTPRTSRHFEKRLDALKALMSADVALDKARWGVPAWGNRSYDFKTALGRLENLYLVPRRTHLFVTHSSSATGIIPAAQKPGVKLVIAAVQAEPTSGNQDEEYIEFANPSNDAIDISGWNLFGGVEFAFEPGTVVPANGSVYVSPDPRTFRARSSDPRGGQGLLVVGPYKGHLEPTDSLSLYDQRGRRVAEKGGLAYTLTTKGKGDVSLKVRGAPAGAELFVLFSLNTRHRLGCGPLLGLGTDALGTVSVPINTHPFHVLASPAGDYNFSAPAGTVPFGLTLDSRALRIDIPAWKLEVSRVLRVRF